MCVCVCVTITAASLFAVENDRQLLKQPINEMTANKINVRRTSAINVHPFTHTYIHMNIHIQEHVLSVKSAPPLTGDQRRKKSKSN